jgi:uncharacterized lipoprotein
VKKITLLVISVLALSSCASRYASNGEQLYLGSRNGQTLVVPPPLSSSNISHFYDLPQQPNNATVSITPPTVETT